MKPINVIEVFEHQRLLVGTNGFKQVHLDALLKLNEYHDGKYFESIAKGLKFNQYVGIIQVDGLVIQINPKADKADQDSRWSGVLLNMLKACGKLKANSIGAANVNRKHLNLLEVYFELYLQELDSLLRKGLVKKYRKQTKNVSSLKGKLEFAGHLQKNIIHKERFYTTHQVYDENHLLHHVLFKALSIVSHFTKGTRLYDHVKRVQLNFSSNLSLNITKSQLENLKLNRKTKDYTYAVELARLIILNFSPDISSGKEKMLSLLFDMNDLWETYILRQLKKISTQHDFEVTGQESKPFWGNNYLRPDIVLRKNGKVYIIDTKWKLPKSNSASVGDLRQMYTYCRFWDAEKAVLLYPGSKSHNYQSYITDDYSKVSDNTISINHQCKKGMVNVFSDNETKLNDNLGLDILKILEVY